MLPSFQEVAKLTRDSAASVEISRRSMVLGVDYSFRFGERMQFAPQGASVMLCRSGAGTRFPREHYVPTLLSSGWRPSFRREQHPALLDWSFVSLTSTSRSYGTLLQQQSRSPTN
jgi:hypothetical protein